MNMDISNSTVLISGLGFFIFLAIFWYLLKKNAESKLSSRLKRFSQFTLFLLIILLVILIFKNHSSEFIEMNT